MNHQGYDDLPLLDTYDAAMPKDNRIVRQVIETIVAIGVMGGFLAATEIGPLLIGCPIKGNISKNTGERIYHVPGQEYYAQTRIDWLSGGRWFCSEADARAGGWRKAGR